MLSDDTYEDAPYTAQSPTLLAQQPVNTKPKDNQQTADWAIAFKRLEARLTTLRNWRYSWWAHWAVLAQYFMPRRFIWLAQTTANRMWRGAPLNNSIIDSTGLMAVRTCAAGMLSGLMSPFRPWFTLQIGLPWIELDAEGKAWLEDTQEKAYTVLDQSNFYTIMAQGFQDVTVFGTAPVVIYEDVEDVIRAYLPATGEYYLGAGSRLSIDTFYREFSYTVAQIVEFAQIENCPQIIVQRGMKAISTPSSWLRTRSSRISPSTARMAVRKSDWSPDPSLSARFTGCADKTPKSRSV
jgi:hypothetical protein